MTPAEKEIITDIRKCNFNDFNVYYKQKSEERKNMTKEEKLVSIYDISYKIFYLMMMHENYCNRIA